jgi:hypothetical protein
MLDLNLTPALDVVREYVAEAKPSATRTGN